jgi:tetratricopeptide (TPR) repeat protein
MKRNIPYMFFLFLLVITSGVVAMKYEKNKNQSGVFLLKERNRVLAAQNEWITVKQTWEKLMKTVRINPEDVKSTLSLATLYLQEGRITGDHLYYDAAAMKYIDEALKREPQNFTGLSLKAMVQLSQHHFSEGLETALEAKKLNPDNAFIHGLLTDAFVELGNYKEAVTSADKMVSIRPDLRSYSRIAYLREIHGDIDGATEAMKMAVNAGLQGDESTAWCRTELGKLFEQKGDRQSAEMHYLLALKVRPGYAYAHAGLGRILADKKDFQNAIIHYNKAMATIDDHSFRQQLSEVFRKMGETTKAHESDRIMIEKMIKANNEAAKDETLGHYSDLELANALLRTRQIKKALEHAYIEYNRRPENMEVNLSLAWILHKKADHVKALSHLEKALRTGCQNPEVLCRAAQIYFSAGNIPKSIELAKQALANDPLIDGQLKEETSAILNHPKSIL